MIFARANLVNVSDVCHVSHYAHSYQFVVAMRRTKEAESES
jgi:hypothetical protein